MLKVRRAYFQWLYSKVRQPNKSYRLLGMYLDKIIFEVLVPNDENRTGDGIRQREIFIEEEQLSYSMPDVDRFYNSPVSLFEVIVAICLSMDFQLDDLEALPRTWKWFEELLSNLGIRWLVDEEFRYRLGAKAEVDEAAHILMSRKYDFNGNGSFFPLRERPKEHMATVEIWYQMMWYLEENYP